MNSFQTSLSNITSNMQVNNAAQITFCTNPLNTYRQRKSNKPSCRPSVQLSLVYTRLCIILLYTTHTHINLTQHITLHGVLRASRLPHLPNEERNKQERKFYFLRTLPRRVAVSYSNHRAAYRPVSGSTDKREDGLPTKQSSYDMFHGEMLDVSPMNRAVGRG